MNGTDIVIVSVLVLIVGGAVAYIIKKKKNGAKCIGCPYGENCKSCCNCKK
ncbi:MAG: FeoB-associated Cys-rich membrane protein [Clostridia bacterium]|nr:FeoB-associated Cys-rich membrane protein [Clostridia bacterium]